MVNRKMRAARFNRQVLIAAGAVALAGNVAFATTYTWTRGANNNNWDSISAGTSNWVSNSPTVPGVPPLLPPGGDTTDLVYSGTLITANSSSSMRQDYTINSLTFAADFFQSATYNVNTPSALLAGATSANLTILGGGITSEVGNGAASFNIAIGRNASLPAGVPSDLIVGADQTWKINAPAPPPGGSALTFSITRQISGSFKVTKTGTGVLVLGLGTPNSNWTGGIDLAEGSIRTGGTDGTNLGQFGTGPIGSTSNNDVSITASTVSTAGGGGARIFDNDLNLGGTGALTFGGSFDLGFTANSTWTLLGDKKIGAGFVTRHDGNITGGFGLTKQGNGMLVLNGANDYTGTTTVADGVLQPRNVAALGTTAGGTVVNVGGALELAGGLTIVGEELTISGLGEGTANAALTIPIQANAGALRNRSGSSVWTGPVHVAAADTYVAVDADSLALPGGVTGDGTSSMRVGGAAGAVSTRHVRLGGLTLDAGAKLTVDSNGTADGTSNLGTLAFAGGVPAPTATIDLKNNALVLGAVNEADVRTLLVAGGSGGTETGTGITSSTAAGNADTALGYAVASEVPANAIFGTVNPTDSLVRYTILGDADLSGATDIDDFGRLAANFNQAGKWSTGDFNYSGVTDIDDFGILAARFNQGIPAAGARGAAVPEPATGACVLLAAGVIGRRRRM